MAARSSACSGTSRCRWPRRWWRWSGFFSFVANWTNYFLPYVLLPGNDQFPVQVGLGTLLDNVPQFNPTVGALAVQRPELALATLLAITPVLLVFLFSQRFLVCSRECWPARPQTE